MSTLLIDGRRIESDEQLFASFHGNSVFTTIKASYRALEWWPEHWQRVTAHARFFGFRIPDEQTVLSEIQSALLSDGLYKVRVILNHRHHAITVEPFELPDKSIYSGVKTIISRFHVHPQLATFKTANSLPYFLAQKEAAQHNVFEALLCHPDGHIVDGSRTSPLLFRDGQLIIFDGGLESIQRNAVIAYAERKNIPVLLNKMYPADLASGQLLLANSLLGVVPVGAPQCPFILELIMYFRGY